jgi:putative transposase
VQRAFTATAPDQLWVADITSIPTWAGVLYLAVVLDAWSRRIIGWAMATHLRTELVLDALNMAGLAASPEGRHPPLGSGLPVHLDRVRPALPRGWRSSLDGFGRRRLRYRDV